MCSNLSYVLWDPATSGVTVESRQKILQVAVAAYHTDWTLPVTLRKVLHWWMQTVHVIN